ncbi:hypothetical protein, partial [Candidatus Liberibacter americanus]
YGTIQSFKKGEIGWGIFGIATDILTLVPVLGSSAKLAFAASIATREAKGLLATAKAVKATSDVVNAIKVEKEISEAIKVEKEISVAKSIIEDKNIYKKYTENPIKTVSDETKIENTLILDKQQKEPSYIEDSNHSYTSLEDINNGKEKLPLPYEIKPSIMTENQKWKMGNYTEEDKKELKNMMEEMLEDFHKLGDSINNQLSLDLTRSTYIINGKVINKSNPEKMIEEIKDMVHQDNRRLQLISTFSNQAIFPNLSIHIMKTDPRLGQQLYGSKNGKTIFEINTLDNNIMQIKATYETKTIPTFEKGDGYDNIKKLNGYGHKIELKLSPDKIISADPYFYTY